MKNKFKGIVKRVAPVCLGFVAAAITGCATMKEYVHQAHEYMDLEIIGSGLIGGVPTYVFYNQNTGDHLAAYVHASAGRHSLGSVYVRGVTKNGTKWRTTFLARPFALLGDCSAIKVDVFGNNNAPSHDRVTLQSEAAGRRALACALRLDFSKGRIIDRNFLRYMQLTQIEKSGGVSMEGLLLWAQEDVPLNLRRPDGVFALERAGKQSIKTGSFLTCDQG